jgi:hypothetical protein
MKLSDHRAAATIAIPSNFGSIPTAVASLGAPIWHAAPTSGPASFAVDLSSVSDCQRVAMPLRGTLNP